MKRPPSIAVRAALVLAASGCWLVCGQWAIAQPTLSHALPGGSAPGKTTELTLHGTKLDQPLQVWTSFPAAIEMVAGDANQKDKTSLVAKISLAAGAPCGIGGIVVATPAGASDVLLVMIDDLPSVSDNGNNHAPAGPQDVQLPVAIDGLSDGTVFDYYRFTAKTGERVSCEVVATRLGWDFDPVVRVLDAAGNEVLRADDDAATAADPRFLFTAPAEGQYLLELRDNRYKAGGRYRLRLGNFPLITTPMPLAATRGAATPLVFSGPLTEGIAALSVLVPPTGDATVPLSIGGAAAQTAGWTTLETTDLPVFVESSPADKPDEPTVAAIPAIFSGRLDAGHDRDLFQFTATKGTPVSFQSITRSAGSGAILMLRLQNAAGSQIAESPIADSDEPLLNFTIPEDGTYRLSVEELAGRGGVDYTYAVRARTGPQFTLTLKNDANNRIRHTLPAGGAFHLDVQCQRFAYDGPIALAIDSDRPGWQVFNSVIGAKANEARLYVVAPLDFAPAELAELRVVGRPADSTGNFSATMATTVQLRAARPQTPFPPAWLDGLILVSGQAPAPSFYSVTADRAEVNFARQVGESKLTLAFKRIDPNFKDAPLVVMPLGLPAGISAEVKRNGNGPDETYDITLKGPKDLAEGQHAFRYFAFAELGTNGRAVQSGDIRLNVITPLAVTAAPAGPLVQGQTQKIKLTLTRRGDDKQPVDLKFKSLPAGVTAPEKTTLAADQAEVEVELTAAADAPAVKFEQLVAVASGKYAGVDITVESPSAVLEVKAP